MWTACCTVFFGFLCCSKFTIPSQATFDQEVHLSLADIAVEQQAIPTVVQSNTDPFRQGVQLYLVKMDTALCPVKTMLAYLTTRDWRMDKEAGLSDTHIGRLDAGRAMHTSSMCAPPKEHLERLSRQLATTGKYV